MALDVLKWLKEDLKVAEDVAKDLASKLEPVAGEIEKGYLRQSDFSRKQDELAAAQAKLDAANAKFEGEIAEWATVQARGEELTKKQRTDLEKAQADVLRLQQVVRRVATDAGLDPDKALEGATVVVKKEEPPPPPDLTGYVKSDDLSTQLGSLAAMALRLPAIFAKIGREHKTLTGQDLDEQAIVAEIEKRANTKGNQKSLDPVVIWEEQHDIPAKRTASAKKQHDDEIAAAEKRGEERALSQSALPGTTPPGQHAPIFQRVDGKERESVLKRPQPGATMNVAVAALRTGKYRSEGHGKKTA